MAFLRQNSDFPPKDMKYYYNKQVEWSAWYSGDPERLLKLYSSSQYFPDNESGTFWARIEKEDRASVVHLPLAGDIASTSSNLLFSEPATFIYKNTELGGKRVENIIKLNGIQNTLIEAAELAAALSGVYLKIDIEPGLVDVPIISAISPLQAIPTFWRGRLWDVLFFRTVYEDQVGSIYRLFENRSRVDKDLLIEYKLFKGTDTSVGQEISIETLEATQNLNLVDTTYKNVEGLGCVYIPNMRPNRLMPGSPIGINDYAGCITMLDSLDFAWTSWMRDIELGMAQIFIDQELLQNNKFNKLQKAFTKLEMSSWKLGTDKIKPIEEVQFDIRVDDHMKTCEALVRNIVSQCGYAPQTFGLDIEGRGESGTALRIRERKSLLTRGKKSKYWLSGLYDLFVQVQRIDAASGLSKGYAPVEVDIVIEDSVLVDPTEQSETLRNLEQARAISTYTKIKIIHPEWAEEDIQAELKRILDESGATENPFETAV